MYFLNIRATLRVLHSVYILATTTAIGKILATMYFVCFCVFYCFFLNFGSTQLSVTLITGESILM